MLYKKLIPQNDSVFRAHNECMTECHEETGALGSYLAKKEQRHRSKDMLDNMPTMMNTRPELSLQGWPQLVSTGRFF